MSKTVRCIINDCKSSADQDLDIKFFRFPPRDSWRYTVWEDVCYGSVNAIRQDSRAHICSKHFRDRDIVVQGLSHTAVPALKLNNPPRCIVEPNLALDSSLTPEQVEKTRLVRLLNDAVVEWAKRSDYYSLMSIPKSDLIKVATKIRKLLGPKLTLNLDNYWCNKLRSRFCRVEPYDRSLKRYNMLDLEQILKKLDLTVKIYKDTDAAHESEKKPECPKLQLGKRPCYYRPKVREGVKNDVTIKPSIAKKNVEIPSTKFSGKRYVKRAKTQADTSANIRSSTQIECTDFELKKELETEDTSKSGALDEVNTNNTLLEEEKIVNPNCSISTVSQKVIEELDGAKPDCCGFKASDDVIDLIETDRNVKEVNPEKCLQCDNASSSTRFKANVLQDNVAHSNGRKKMKTNPDNISQDFLKNYLSYIYNYDEHKQKLPIPLVAKSPVRLNPKNDGEIKSKPRSPTEFSKNVIFQTVIKPEVTHLSEDSLLENECVEENKSQLMSNIVSPINDSELNVKNEPLTVDMPDVDQLVKNNKVRDVICFDGYWSSDDSTFGERPESKIASYTKALDYLKPLEDFVLRKENFRAIGLVSILEIHFKRQALLRRENIH